jgi:hypothetical protein
MFVMRMHDSRRFPSRYIGLERVDECFFAFRRLSVGGGRYVVPA